MKNAIFFVIGIIIWLICLTCNTATTKENVKTYLDNEYNYKYLNKIVHFKYNKEDVIYCENRIKLNENVISQFSSFSGSPDERINHPYKDQSKLIKERKELSTNYVGLILRFKSVDSLAFSYGREFFYAFCSYKIDFHTCFYDNNSLVLHLEDTDSIKKIQFKMKKGYLNTIRVESILTPLITSNEN